MTDSDDTVTQSDDQSGGHASTFTPVGPTVSDADVASGAVPVPEAPVAPAAPVGDLPPVAVADIQRLRADLDEALRRVEDTFETLDGQAVAAAHRIGSELRTYLKRVHV